MRNEEKKYLNYQDAADFIGVHRVTLFQWIKKDREIKKNNLETEQNLKCPKYYKVGGRYRFLKEDLESFIKESKAS